MKNDAETHRDGYFQIWPDTKVYGKYTLSGRPTKPVQTSNPYRDRAIDSLHQRVSQKILFCIKTQYKLYPENPRAKQDTNQH